MSETRPSHPKCEACGKGVLSVFGTQRACRMTCASVVIERQEDELSTLRSRVEALEWALRAWEAWSHSDRHQDREPEVIDTMRHEAQQMTDAAIQPDCERIPGKPLTRRKAAFQPDKADKERS